MLEIWDLRCVKHLIDSMVNPPPISTLIEDSLTYGPGSYKGQSEMLLKLSSTRFVRYKYRVSSYSRYKSFCNTIKLVNPFSLV